MAAYSGDNLFQPNLQGLQQVRNSLCRILTRSVCGDTEHGIRVDGVRAETAEHDDIVQTTDVCAADNNAGLASQILWFKVLAENIVNGCHRQNRVKHTLMISNSDGIIQYQTESTRFDRFHGRLS